MGKLFDKIADKVIDSWDREAVEIKKIEDYVNDSPAEPDEDRK